MYWAQHRIKTCRDQDRERPCTHEIYHLVGRQTVNTHLQQWCELLEKKGTRRLISVGGWKDCPKQVKFQQDLRMNWGWSGKEAKNLLSFCSLTVKPWKMYGFNFIGSDIGSRLSVNTETLQYSLVSLKQKYQLI